MKIRTIRGQNGHNDKYRTNSGLQLIVPAANKTQNRKTAAVEVQEYIIKLIYAQVGVSFIHLLRVVAISIANS